MIYAEGSFVSDAIHLKIIYPGNLPPKFAIVKTEGDARREVYSHNRSHIIGMLVKYFNWRFHAVCFAGMAIPKRSAEFQITLKFYKSISLFELSREVVMNVDAIKAVAPSEKSKHYAYYQREILSIVDFCKSLNS